MDEFQLPEQLQGFTEDEIHERMLDKAPSGIDTTEGGMFYDHTRPVAMMLDETINFRLRSALAIMFPQYAWREYLDLHGEPIGVPRRQATYSTVLLSIEGKAGLHIDKSTLVYTLGDEEEEATYFRTDYSTKISSSGTTKVTATAVEPGSLSNVAPHTLIGIKIDNVNVTNEFAAEDGFDEEDDDDYRQRIIERNQNKPSSGNADDYKHWATEVEGVGRNPVIKPLFEGPGTVLVLITDVHGGVANEELINRVQSYIDPIKGKGEGRAPIGAHVTVDTVNVVLVIINIKLVLYDDYDETRVQQDVIERIKKTFSDTSTITYTQVGATVARTEGVSDYTVLTINGDISNVSLREEERPSFEVIFE